MLKTITDQLFEAGKGIIERKPEVSDPSLRFTMADDGGVEVETGEFLYGLVRITKPNLILETGTYTGISSMYMGQALKDNHEGKIITLEIDQTHKERAERLWNQVGVADQVNCQLIKSLNYNTESLFDMLFLDSEPEFRFQELVKFYPQLKYGGFVLIHDLHHHLSQHPNSKFFGWPFGKLPEQIVELISTGRLRYVPLPTPRGLAMFYKTKEGDYPWT